MKIGFFDSGLGGLLMMHSCKKKYLFHDYVYIGDTMNIPYGPKDAKFILENMEPYLLWLFNEKKCDYVCIACNTASIKALPLFIKKYPGYKKKFIDILHPTQQYLREQHLSSIVLATQGTVLSNCYNVSSSVHQIAMPGLVELIEGNKVNEALLMIKDVLSYYPKIDIIILACTHYIFLKKELQNIYPYCTIITQDIFINEKIDKLSINKFSSEPEYYVSSQAEEYSYRYKRKFNQLNL